jgi:hypothetical protein
MRMGWNERMKKPLSAASVTASVTPHRRCDQYGASVCQQEQKRRHPPFLSSEITPNRGSIRGFK